MRKRLQCCGCIKVLTNEGELETWVTEMSHYSGDCDNPSGKLQLPVKPGIPGIDFVGFSVNGTFYFLSDYSKFFCVSACMYMYEYDLLWFSFLLMCMLAIYICSVRV